MPYDSHLTSAPTVKDTKGACGLKLQLYNQLFLFMIYMLLKTLGQRSISCVMHHKKNMP